MIMHSVIVKAVVVLTAALNKDEYYNQDNKRGGVLKKLPFVPKKYNPFPRRSNASLHHDVVISSNPATDDSEIEEFVPHGVAASVCRGGGSGTAAVSSTAAKKESFLKRHPFAGAIMITTLNAFSADLLTQLVFEKNPWNPARSAVFAAFGFLYQGIVQYAIVNFLWEKLFPGNSKRAILSKICAMNLLSDPLFFMPTFYIFKETLTQNALAWTTVKTALLGYKANCFMDWRNSWMVWFPGHAVTYGVMPPHQRIPWMACVGFVYMTVLSITRGGV